jgi:hypothetical protein
MKVCSVFFALWYASQLYSNCHQAAAPFGKKGRILYTSILPLFYSLLLSSIMLKMGGGGLVKNQKKSSARHP